MFCLNCDYQSPNRCKIWKISLKISNGKQGFPKVWMKCLEIAKLQDFAPNTQGLLGALSGPQTPCRIERTPSENFCLRACSAWVVYREWAIMENTTFVQIIIIVKALNQNESKVNKHDKECFSNNTTCN